MSDFYFAYDYSSINNTASKLCRHINHAFEIYDPIRQEWVKDNELARIFIGEDMYYDEITEDQAKKIIENLNKQ